MANHLASLLDVLALRVVEDEAAELTKSIARGALVSLPRRGRQEEVTRYLPVVSLRYLEARVRHVGVRGPVTNEGAVGPDRLSVLVLEEVAVGDAELGQGRIPAVRVLSANPPKQRIGGQTIPILERAVSVLVGSAGVLAVTQRPRALVATAGGEEERDRNPVGAVHGRRLACLSRAGKRGAVAGRE